jgi:hypothetical protein
MYWFTNSCLMHLIQFYNFYIEFKKVQRDFGSKPKYIDHACILKVSLDFFNQTATALPIRSLCKDTCTHCIHFPYMCVCVRVSVSIRTMHFLSFELKTNGSKSVYLDMRYCNCDLVALPYFHFGILRCVHWCWFEVICSPNIWYITRNSGQKLFISHCSTNTKLHSFSFRTARSWNKLSSITRYATEINAFKNLLDIDGKKFEYF